MGRSTEDVIKDEIVSKYPSKTRWSGGKSEAGFPPGVGPVADGTVGPAAEASLRVDAGAGRRAVTRPLGTLVNVCRMGGGGGGGNGHGSRGRKLI